VRCVLARALAVPLAPLLLRQGRRVRRDTPALPEAAGERSGRAALSRPGRPLRLLILGDSSAAGVGAATQDEALAGRLAQRLAAVVEGPLHWTLVARTGATTRDAIALLEAQPPASFDVAVVALGVNEATALRPARRWLADVDRLTRRLHERHRVRRVVWSGLPPMHRFPALPQPLRAVIGLHALGLDAALARWCAARPAQALHAPLPPMTEPSLAASDGFHPAPAAYALWADALLPAVLGSAPGTGP
jgi:lysophospholipase L1-like esterase